MWGAICYRLGVGDAAIEIECLSKRYGRFKALDEVSLRVPSGCVFGLLGPNGAGKSTLVKSLLTIVRPSRCRGRLLGAPVGHRSTLARVGYLPEQTDFPAHLSGRELVGFIAGLAGVPRRGLRQRIAEVLASVGMLEQADRPCGTYSKGMRQRVGLAQALIRDPELVFLDEPTDGVDPAGRVEIRGLIEAMREQGRTVFVNSHLLAEVEQVVDAVAIMARGRIVQSGSLDELTRKGRRYEIRTQGPVPLDLRGELEAGGAVVGGDWVEVEDTAAAQSVLDRLRQARVVIREMRERRSTLEEVFLEVTGSEQEGRAA